MESNFNEQEWNFSQRVCCSMPIAGWNSREERKNRYQGIFLKDPNSVAKQLKRPSAPKQKAVRWPESFSCHNLQAFQKPVIQRSVSYTANLHNCSN